MDARPKLAIWKFASCDGCQLTLLDCEDELLDIAAVVRIARFQEASSATLRGPYDISLVEGSITTAVDAEALQRVRVSSKLLVSIGACATAGGIQALRNLHDVRELTATVYARPELIDTLATSTPIADHVRVDYELRGCPIDRAQLLDLLSSLLAGRTPALPTGAVCLECKLRGSPCIMAAHGTPCLGPVTRAGCGAICPALDRGCFGCFGPKESPNTRSLSEWWRGTLGVRRADVAHAYRTFNVGAEPFGAEADAND